MHWQNRSQKIVLTSDSEAFFWTINLQEITSQEMQEVLLFLDSETLQRSKRFTFEQDQYRHLLSHAVLRAKIGELIGQKPSEISFIRNDYGKPFLKGKELFFNLSHTKERAFFGIHLTCPIGTDIEDCKISTKIESVPEENLCEFLRSWCAEEAYLKALGTGFSSPRPKLELYSSVQGVDFWKTNNAEIHVYNKIIPKCKLAVCVLKDMPEHYMPTFI